MQQPEPEDDAEALVLRLRAHLAAILRMLGSFDGSRGGDDRCCDTATPEVPRRAAGIGTAPVRDPSKLPRAARRAQRRNKRQEVSP